MDNIISGDSGLQEELLRRSSLEPMSLNVWHGHTQKTVPRPTVRASLTLSSVRGAVIDGEAVTWVTGDESAEGFPQWPDVDVSDCRTVVQDRWRNYFYCCVYVSLLGIQWVWTIAWGGRHAQRTGDMLYWHAEWWCCHSHCCWPAGTGGGLLLLHFSDNRFLEHT